MPLDESNLHQKILSGARATVHRNGVEVGHATGFRCTVTIRNYRHKNMGSPLTAALVPVEYDVSCSLDFIRIVTSDVVKEGVLPGCDAATIRMWPEVTLQLLDDETDTVMATIIGAMPAGYNWSVANGTVCAEDVSFDARMVKMTSEA